LGDSQVFCENLCRHAWRAGKYPPFCDALLPGERSSGLYTFDPLDDDIWEQSSGFSIWAICREFPAFDECTSLDFELYRWPLYFGQSFSPKLFSDDFGNIGHSYLCRAGGGYGVECPSESVADWLICIADEVKKSRWLEYYDTHNEQGKYEVVIGAKAACCAKYPDNGVDACRVFTEQCSNVKNGTSVVDDYGSPVGGPLLTFFKPLCLGETPTDGGSEGLSGGAIAGIVVSSILVVGGVAGALVFFLVIRKDKTATDDKADA
jgi:hypothetical protein